MLRIELVEGKDNLKELGKGAGDGHGLTIGSLLRLIKLLHGAGKIVILSSSFNTLQGLI